MFRELASCLCEGSEQLCGAALGIRVREHALEREGSSQGDDGLGTFWADDVLRRESQMLGEHADQMRVEGERPAFEDDGRVDVEALRQAAERLLGDGMKRREGEVLLARAGVEEGLDVGLGVHAAAPRDVVDRGAHRCCIVEPFDVDLEQRGDLVDERARAACARAVHAHVGDGNDARLVVALEEDHLGVLPAELDGAARLRVALLDRRRVGDDFLNVGDAELGCEVFAPRAAHREAAGAVGEALEDLFDDGLEAFDLVREVAPVGRVEDIMSLRVEDDGLRGGGADVQPDAVG